MIDVVATQSTASSGGKSSASSEVGSARVKNDMRLETRACDYERGCAVSVGGGRDLGKFGDMCTPVHDERGQISAFARRRYLGRSIDGGVVEAVVLRVDEKAPVAGLRLSIFTK